MEDTTAVFGAWPGDAEVAVALTFDVDGEAKPGLARAPEYGRRLTLLSQAHFWPQDSGLGRILDLLPELNMPGTFATCPAISLIITRKR